MLKTKQHIDIMAEFEKLYSCERLDKEQKDLWGRGIIYQSGDVNALFDAFRKGVSLGILMERESGDGHF